MRILALVEAPGHVCCRYRVLAYEHALSQAGCELSVEGLARGPVDRLRQLRGARHYDVTLLQHRLLPAWQLKVLRGASHSLVFDFDDAVLYRDSYDSRGPHCGRRLRRFRKTMRQADLLLAGNEFLAQIAVDHGAKADSVRFMPTCIDTSRYPESRRSPKPGFLDLIWVGSSSTQRGLDQKQSLWAELGRRYPQLTLRVLSDQTAHYPPLRVKSLAWSEQTEVSTIASSDVGISWLPDDLWSRGKCGLKVLQYMAAGLPVVANPVGVHDVMIQPGRTGLLVSNDSEWLDAIAALLAEPQIRAAMGAAGREVVKARFSVAAWADRFVAALTGRVSQTKPWHNDANRQGIPAPASSGARQPTNQPLASKARG